MATFNKFNQFVEDKNHGKHDFSNDTIMVALTNTLPVAGNSILANITQVSYTNLSSRVLSLDSSGQAGGVYKVSFDDLTLSASGGSVGPFRYAVIYNDSQATPAKPLIGWYDRTASVTLGDGESILLDLDQVNGLFDDQ